jgi:hypothetical protein
MRSSAIRLAASACARALHVAIARNPLFVARFVDDALRAMRTESSPRARLHPRFAIPCAPLIGCELVSDESLEPGEVILEAAGTRLSATLEERALDLVRSIADE